MQQEQDTKGKRFHRRASQNHNVPKKRSGMFRHFRRPEQGQGGLCLVNMHCPPPPCLKLLEARFQAYVLRK